MQKYVPTQDRKEKLSRIRSLGQFRVLLENTRHIVGGSAPENRVDVVDYQKRPREMRHALQAPWTHNVVGRVCKQMYGG